MSLEQGINHIYLLFIIHLLLEFECIYNLNLGTLLFDSLLLFFYQCFFSLSTFTYYSLFNEPYNQEIINHYEVFYLDGIYKKGIVRLFKKFFMKCSFFLFFFFLLSNEILFLKKSNIRSYFT